MKRQKRTVKKLSKKLTKSATKHTRRLRRDKKLRLKFFTLSTLLLLAITAAIYGLASTITNPQPNSRLVTFHDRGEEHVILTRATSVKKALRDANITVSSGDVVEPSIDSELRSTDSAVIIHRARPVLIVDGAVRQKIVTAAASPNELLTVASMDALQPEDTAQITTGNLISDGASAVLTVERKNPVQAKPVFAPGPNALTASKGAQLFTDSNGVVHRETYYDLPMNIVIRHCSSEDYSIREDGAKIDSDGYVLVAASYRNYPKCSVVETSMGPGKVYDTGGFALRYPHGFDLATDWSNRNGR